MYVSYRVLSGTKLMFQLKFSVYNILCVLITVYMTCLLLQECINIYMPIYWVMFSVYFVSAKSWFTISSIREKKGTPGLIPAWLQVWWCDEWWKTDVTIVLTHKNIPLKSGTDQTITPGVPEYLVNGQTKWVKSFT